MIRLLASMAARAVRKRLHAVWMQIRFDYAMVSDAIDQAREAQRNGK